MMGLVSRTKMQQSGSLILFFFAFLIQTVQKYLHEGLLIQSLQNKTFISFVPSQKVQVTSFPNKNLKWDIRNNM